MAEIQHELPERDRATADLIAQVATARGLELSENRLLNLVAYNEYLQRNLSDSEKHDIKTILIYNRDGLKVNSPRPIRGRGFSFEKASMIDFIPIVGDENTVANPHPQRGKTSEITLKGIHAFQDFVLLTDAGQIEKPDSFYGMTNPTMARFARRIGFEPMPSYENGVIASFETVAERVFSPEMAEIEKKLQTRLGTVAVGS